MENVLQFIKTNPTQTAIIVLLLLAYIIYIIWKLKEKGLKPFIVEFIVKAEENFKQGENQEKMDFVIEKIIALIPLPFSVFITKNMVKKLIQSVFDEIKKALDYQPVMQDVSHETIEEK